MTPQEALAMLDKICASVSLNREVHVRVQEAVAVLKNAINPKTAGLEEVISDENGAP